MVKRLLHARSATRKAGNAASTPPLSWDAVVRAGGEAREGLLRELAAGMRLREKTRQMAGRMKPWEMLLSLARYNYHPFRSGANRRLGIPPIRFTDGPRGVALGRCTCFPVSMARGATWDTALEERIGEAMGAEARSLGADFLAAVCINLLRHPGWGRAQETYGEDPYLLGEMGAASVRGLQKHVMACVKHFACNSIEESRFYVDVRIDERALRELYLPHFKRCVDEGVAAVMSAYNRVNGEYCAHNSHLLRAILKGEWGFRGLVMSDFVLGTRDTVKAALGGLDIEMPHAFHFGRRLRRAVREGRVPEHVVDEAVVRILRQKARFANVGTGEDYGTHRVACPEHVALAREAARKSIVLLKNENGALPLRRGEVGKLAVIGRLADLANLGDHGSSRVRPPYAVTVLQGLRDRAGDSVRVEHCDGKDIAAARRAAREADACVLVVGLTFRNEGEAMPGPLKVGGDREDLALRPVDVELLEAVSRESKRCVVVLEGGSALLTSGWRDAVEAILVAWYPGMEGGNAVAEVIFGDANPSGKLPVTFPENNGQLPHFDRKAASIDYGYYHGYRLLDREGTCPAFAFGFGLSYTTYEYRGLRLNAEEIPPEGTLQVEVEIANTGGMAGEEVAQLYVGYPSSRVERPVKELKGFARVSLAPGESRSVSFTLKGNDLAYYDAEKGRWEVEETTYHVFAGPSSRPEDLRLEGSFRIAAH